jgi:hypothetical protein
VQKWELIKVASQNWAFIKITDWSKNAKAAMPPKKAMKKTIKNLSVPPPPVSSCMKPARRTNHWRNIAMKITMD